jgi:hypothetical protein
MHVIEDLDEFPVLIRRIIEMGHDQPQRRLDHVSICLIQGTLKENQISRVHVENADERECQREVPQ